MTGSRRAGQNLAVPNRMPHPVKIHLSGTTHRPNDVDKRGPPRPDPASRRQHGVPDRTQPQRHPNPTQGRTVNHRFVNR